MLTPTAGKSLQAEGSAGAGSLVIETLWDINVKVVSSEVHAHAASVRNNPALETTVVNEDPANESTGDFGGGRTARG